MKPHFSWALAATTVLGLAACGGGGGGDITPPSIYAVNAAQRHLLVDGGSWTMTGLSGTGSLYTITLALTPLPAALPINSNTAYPRVRQLLTLQQGNAAPVVVGQNFYFDGQSLALIQARADDNTCSVSTANTALPANATVGAGGAFYSFTDLVSCASGAASSGTTTTTWSLESESGVALLCWNATGKDTANVVIATMASCVQVAADGTLGTKARLTLAADGFTTTARNY